MNVRRLACLCLISLITLAGCADETLQAIPNVCFEDIDCDDADPCTLDLCDNGVACQNLVLEDGDTCVEDGFDGICLGGLCGESVCGDGYLDLSVIPAEQCDDGNTHDGDGCAADCTQGKPEVVIEYPGRGETVGGETVDGNGTVAVRGWVDDKGVGLSAFRLNGDPIALGADGAFEYTMDAAHGLNVADIYAANLLGESARATVGFYFSDAWAQPGAAATDHPDGMMYRLSQEAFDDFDHPCRTVDGVYQCDEIDDLATVGEIILNGLSEDDFVGSNTRNELNMPTLTIPVGLPAIEVDGVGSIYLNGEIGIFGGVAVASEVVDVDFNEVALELIARNGGLDATVEISPSGETPGFTYTIRNSVSMNFEVRFMSVNATLETDWLTINSMDLICVFMPPGPPWNTVCPEVAGGPLAPIGALEPDPTAWVDSSMSIESMILETGFNVATPAPGEVEVTLVEGTVDFQGGTIDLQPLYDLQVDLGGLSILGGQTYIDMGSMDLGIVADGLSLLIEPLLGLFVNDLQFALEPAINYLLLNPYDPLNVGQIVEDTILGLGLDQPLLLSENLPEYLPAPEIQLQTELTSLEFKEAEGGTLLDGGMIAGFGAVLSTERVNSGEPLGAMLEGTCGDGEFAFSEVAGMESALHLDTLNRALFSAWWNGAMTFPVETQELDATVAFF